MYRNDAVKNTEVGEVTLSPTRLRMLADKIERSDPELFEKDPEAGVEGILVLLEYEDGSQSVVFYDESIL